MLSSPAIVDGFFSSLWYNKTLTLLRNLESLSEDALTSFKMAHIDAFHDGIASSVTVSKSENIRGAGFHRFIGYAEGILVWITKDQQNLCLRCLASGKSAFLAPSNRAYIEYRCQGPVTFSES